MTEQDIDKERLELVLEAAGLDLWENNLVTGEVTRKATKIFAELGYSEEDVALYIEDLFQIVHPDDIAALKIAIHAHLTGIAAQYRCEFRVKAKSGKWIWYANYGKIMDRNGINRGERFIGVTFNINDRKHQEILLAARELEWRTLVENSPNTICRYDHECRRIYVNPALCAMAEGGCAAMLAKKPSEYPGGEHAEIFERQIQTVFATGKNLECELTWKGIRGKIFCSHIRLTAEFDLKGAVVTVLGVGFDITELNLQRQKIREMAFYDPLTGLPNRRLLIDRLQQALAFSARTGQRAALLFIDLDNFKTINDTLGHDTGDMLLQQVGERLVSCVREGDTVARMGGDEFVIILEGLSVHLQESAFQVETLAEMILVNLNQPYQLVGHIRHSTPSIGITLFSKHIISTDELMKQADIAMYSAKKAGRNAIRFFDAEMQRAVEHRSSLHESLKHALPKHQLRLYYQAQVDNTDRIVGAEILLRWLDPARGMVLPDEFITVAEETGLIVAIGLWVLETACQQLKTWGSDPNKSHLHLAVNVSARQFQQADFVEQVVQALQGVNPARLKLELTESMVLGNIADTIDKMHALKKLGVKFAMDDFGTGYSSLSSLKKLPLDQLKIDQSFVHDIAADQDGAIIVQTIIAMANKLGMEVIAEGVETQAQKDFLTQHSCLHFQGYLFGWPVPLEEFERALKRSEPLLT